MATIEIKKDRGGWAMQYKAYSLRPYAVFMDGQPLRTKAGAIRTFGDRDSARQAANKVVGP
jgi:hypothetical protein